jgi:hypothetical protein
MHSSTVRPANKTASKTATKTVRKVIRKRSALNGHAVPVCENGKLRYRSREQAQDALVKARHAQVTAEALGRSTGHREKRSYACPTCAGWHLTSSAAWTSAGAR